MSNLFILSNTEQTRTLTLENEDDIDIVTDLLDIGEPLTKPVKALKLKALKSDMLTYTRELPIDDFPSFYGLTACEKAKDIINPYIANLGEWIEMKFAGVSYFYFNCTLKLDALDIDNTELWIEDGYEIGIKKYVFKSLDYSKTPIFKLSYSPNHPLIVTSEFINMVESNKLSGLNFKLL